MHTNCPPFLESNILSQLIGSSNLCTFHCQHKVCVKYIWKSIALDHSVTNKVLKEQAPINSYLHLYLRFMWIHTLLYPGSRERQ